MVVLERKHFKMSAFQGTDVATNFCLKAAESLKLDTEFIFYSSDHSLLHPGRFIRDISNLNYFFLDTTLLMAEEKIIYQAEILPQQRGREGRVRNLELLAPRHWGEHSVCSPDMGSFLGVS